MSTQKAERLIFDAKLKSDRDYWIERLSGEFGETNLRLDFDRPPAGPALYQVITVRAGTTTCERLAKLTGNDDLLAHTLLLAALKVCLYKYTNNTPVVVGSPSIRGEDNAPGTPNVLAIVDDIDDRLPFKPFLLQVQESLKAAYQRQNYPFDHLLKDLGLSEEGNRYPLFDVALAFKSIHHEMPEVAADVVITFEKSHGSVVGEIKYRRDLFRRATMERFARHFMSVLDHALERIESPLGDLLVLTTSERHALVVEWNDTRAEDAESRCIPQVLEAKAANAPFAVAVKSEREHLSYGELNRRANQLAHYLRSLGVGPEAIVGICMERSLSMIIGVLGVLKAGAAYLPMDPTYPQDRLQLMLHDAQVPFLLTQESLVERFAKSDASIIALDTQGHFIEGHCGDNPQAAPAPENLAYVIYTSGSTGQPKGVLIDHCGLSSLVNAQVHGFELTANDRVLQFASLGFDASVSEIFTTLAAGANLELGEPDSLYVGAFLNQIVKTREVTTVTLPPAVMMETRAEAMPSLRAIIAAGDACPASTAARWAEHRLFINAYGPTEVAVCASLFKSPEGVGGTPPIGRPLEDKRTYLLDAGLRPVPLSASGELFVGGPGLARGYLNQPALTAERFLPDPFADEPGARLYRTGDLAYQHPNGSMVFLGRTDHQVKIRGFRVELGEIESALIAHPSVQEAVVATFEHGAGGKQLAAYVVGKPGSDWVAGELRNHLKATLPSYMIPSVFVPLSAVPLTAVGKVDRRKLPNPRPQSSELEDSYVAPRTELESKLAEIFGKSLGYHHMGIYDNFFELGGHSLLAVQLISHIRKEFGIEMDVIVAFEAPTVVEMAVMVVQAQMEQLGIDSSSEVLVEIEQLPEGHTVADQTDL